MMKCENSKVVMECVKVMEEILDKMGIQCFTNVEMFGSGEDEFSFAEIELFHDGLYSTINVDDYGIACCYSYGKDNNWMVKDFEDEKLEAIKWRLADTYTASFHLEEILDKRVEFYEKAAAYSEVPTKQMYFSNLYEKFKNSVKEKEYYINAKGNVPGAGLYELNKEVYKTYFREFMENFLCELKHFHVDLMEVEEGMK